MRAIPCDCEQNDDDGGCLVPEPSYVECPEDAVNVGEHIDTKMLVQTQNVMVYVIYNTYFMGYAGKK